MGIFQYTLTRYHLFYLHQVDKKLDHTLNFISVSKRDKVLEKFDTLQKMIPRYPALNDLIYRDWASKFEDKIRQRNDLIETLLDQAEQFIKTVSDYKNDPSSMSYLAILNRYDDLIKALITTKLNDETFTKAKAAYQQLSSAHTLWSRDYAAFKGLKEAYETEADIKDKFITASMYQTLLGYQRQVDHIKKLGTDFSYDVKPYERVLRFYTDIAAYAEAANTKFLYQHLFKHYHAHKSDPDFSLEAYLEYLNQTYGIKPVDLSMYFEHIQNDTLTDFERHLVHQIKSLIKDVRIIQNFYYKKDDMKHRVDLIVFIQGHIYVLNCHNYTGTIRGFSTVDQWEHQILENEADIENSKRTGHAFKNPMKQNQTHIEWLNTICPYDYESAPIFPDTAQLNITGYGTYKVSDFIKQLRMLDAKDVDTRLIFYTLALENIVE